MYIKDVKNLFGLHKVMLYIHQENLQSQKSINEKFQFKNRQNIDFSLNTS